MKLSSTFVLDGYIVEYFGKLDHITIYSREVSGGEEMFLYFIMEGSKELIKTIKITTGMAQGCGFIDEILISQKGEFLS